MEASVSTRPVQVLFVCLGNICRSPLAQGVFEKIVEERDAEDYFQIDSAGTGRWHIGESPDQRMQQTAQEHGISIAEQTARQFTPADLETYDYVLVMDQKNRRRVLETVGSGSDREKVTLFREFDPDPGDYEVPDPYYGGSDGFERVYQIVERTCQSLFDELVEKHKLPVE